MAEFINVHEAKTHLSRLLEGVERGESFIIARGGKPVARLVKLETRPSREPQRIGFLEGEIQVPEDFDRLGQDEIQHLFGLGDEASS